MTTAAAPKAPGVERYRKLFETRSYAQDALRDWRQAALDRFIELGFPTQRDERWKYTNLRRLESRNFTLPEPTVVAPESLPTLNDVGRRIVFVDGQYMPSVSSAGALPPGITVLSIGQWLKNDPEHLAQFLAPHAPAADNAFECLNAAFLEDGIVVEVAPDTRFEEPLYLFHYWRRSGVSAHPRIIVRAGRNSRFTLIEHFAGGAGVESFTNVSVTIEAQSGAQVEHYRLQQESAKAFHISNVRARIERDARYSCHELALGATLGRSEITTLLEGAGADAQLRGLFTPSGSQHLDNYTRIEHIAPHTTSTEEYRGVADGRGRGIFNGKVKVHANAQKIDARQLSRNLLLSPTAEIDTKPELEIYANDVKCSHGATTGQLDPVSLFYLRSRGLDADEARALLIRAFAESVLATIQPKGLRAALERWLSERFGSPGSAA